MCLTNGIANHINGQHIRQAKSVHNTQSKNRVDQLSATKSILKESKVENFTVMSKQVNVTKHSIFYGILITIFVITKIDAASVKSENERVLNVAVIGSGTSGLASAKYALAEGYDVTIYEQAEELGGIWYYTNETGKDQYGVDIHTAMYQGLR